jgi:hypothetical protein
VRRSTLLIDVGIAALVAIVVLTVVSGVAIAALLAIFVLLVCGVSFALDARRSGSRRTRPPRGSTRRR